MDGTTCTFCGAAGERRVSWRAVGTGVRTEARLCRLCLLAVTLLGSVREVRPR